MVDLTPDEDGKPRARLLDLVPGRSGKAYSDWLDERGEDFTRRRRGRHPGPVPRLQERHRRPTRGRRRRARRLPRRQARHPSRRRGPPPGAAGDPRPPRPQGRPALRHPHDPALRRREAHRPATSTTRPGDRRRRTPRRGLRRLAVRPATPLGLQGHRTRSRAGGSPRRSSRRCRPARSRRSSDSARPSSSGARRSWPTSTPAAPATAAPKRSTASSNSTAASPAASATASTTDYACCSSAADSTHPHLR